MERELRPLSLGEILDRTFAIYRAHFLMFVGISTLAAAVDLVWKLIQSGTVRMIQPHASVKALGFTTVGFGLVSLLIYVVASALAIAAINRAVSAVYLGQPTGIAMAYNEIKPHWFRYIRLYVVAFFLAWGAAAVAVIAIGALAGIMASKGAAAATMGFAALGLSMLVVVPFGVWMMLRYSLANASCVFENIGVKAALKRSIFLTVDMRGKIFVMFLLAGTLIMVLTYSFLIPVIVAAVKHQGQVSLATTIFTLFASFAVTSLTTPFYGIALTLFYYDARIRKEGFDIDWMMQRSLAADPVGELSSVSPAAPILG